MLDIKLIGILQVGMMAGMFLFVYYFIKFIKSQESELKPHLEDLIARDKSLDLEVHVVPEKDNNTPYLFMFMGGFMLLLGPTLLTLAYADGQIDILIIIPLIAIALGMGIIYISIPFKAKGRLIISPKLVILPYWTIGVSKFGQNMFRVENIEAMTVHRHKRTREVIRISFAGRVYGSTRLWKGDQDKYEQIIRFLRELGVRVNDGVAKDYGE